MKTPFKLAALVAACCSTAALAGDIKVGSVAGVTGPIAELVAPIVAGRNLAAQHVNEQGGLLDGDTMRMVLADSACDPKAGVDAGNKVVNVEQVVAIVGASCSGATNGMVSSVSIPAGVMSISDSATAPSISELEDNGLVFRVAPSDAYQGAALAELVYADGNTKVAMTYANDDYNAGIAEVFERAFEAAGGTITGNQAHEPKKASYRSELSTLSRGGPQALVVFSYYGSGGITILKNSLENGLFSSFYAADGMFDQSVIDQIGADNLRGNIKITQSSSDTGDASYQAFATLYGDATGDDPGAPYVAHGYDAAFMTALAIERAKSTDRAAIAAAMTKIDNPPGMIIRPGEWAKAKAALAAGEPINYEGASGNVDFDENGDVGGVYGVNTVNDEGTWTQTLLK
ncbi:MAG: ABC transporter substrate-binding protein [Pseudomonadota bacterium]